MIPDLSVINPSLPNISEQVQESTFDFSKEQEAVTRLVGSWEAEKQHVTIRRDVRRFDVNVEEMRTKKKIGPDETYVPIREIDSAISREKPSQVSFLEQSRRLVIFTDVLDPSIPCEDLEISFARWMRYQDWNVPWHQAVDACDLHGGCALEVIFDPAKPLHCAVEYIERENLIFPLKTKRLQSCERVIRVYEYMAHELEDAVEKYGFDQGEVKKLVDSKGDTQRDEPIKIYKVYKKIKGVVWVYWMGNKETASKFLVEPQKLQLGLYNTSQSPEMVQQLSLQAQMTGVPLNSLLPQQEVTFYPFFYLVREILEDLKLLHCKGAAAKVLPVQEALTQLYTNIVNASIKASKVYASADQDPNDDPADNKELTPIEGDNIYPKRTTFFAFPWPDPIVLQITQNLMLQNQQTLGQIDFAAVNRKDSRKTAAEMQAAMAQQQALTSVDVLPLSICVREVYFLCWRIAQSQIWLGAVQFPPVPLEKVLRIYQLSAAGDIDVVQRGEKKQLIQQVFPILSQTSAQQAFLQFMLDNFFPEEAKRWEVLLNQGDPKALISAFIQVLRAVPTNELNSNELQQLNQLIAAGEQYLGGTGSDSTQGMGAQSNNQSTASTAGAGGSASNSTGSQIRQNERQ